MPEAIRTRCKFRVVGVEDTEYEIVKTVESDAEGYADIDAPETTVPARAGLPERKYKTIRTGTYNQNVRLAASYDSSNPEDISFAAATPSGELKIYVSNPAVIGTFKPGKNYYLDLTPCD